MYIHQNASKLHVYSKRVVYRYNFFFQPPFEVVHIFNRRNSSKVSYSIANEGKGKASIVVRESSQVSVGL